MKMVLAPLDFSDATPRVVDEAAKLAEAMEGYVVLLHVARMPQAMPHHSTQMAHLAEAVHEAEITADRQLSGIAENLKARGVVTQLQRLTGEPKKDVVEQAVKLAADYVVMGSHGHSALHDLVLGSVTSAVIKHSNRVVVVVPVPRRDRNPE